MQNQILKSGLIVLCFWGFVLSVYNADGYFDIRLMAMELSLGILFASMSIFASNTFRERRFARLGSHEVHGLVSAMGEVPVHRALVNSDQKINASLYVKSIPPELVDLDPRSLYASAYSESHPYYVELYEAVLRLLMDSAFTGLPATYCIDKTEQGQAATNKDRHGGRTLLQHSLLVSGLSMKLAADFSAKYRPEKPSRANAPGFTPNPNDPLSGLLGLAHDLGKLITFQRLCENDGVIAARVMRNHDLMGARTITDLPEFWSPKISFEDRAIIQNILAVYHHPYALPVSPSSDDIDGPYKYRSDRERALLVQLVESDLLATQLESGTKLDLSLVGQNTSLEAPIDDAGEDFTSLFFQFLVGHGLSNNHGKSIGFKAEHDGAHLVVFDQNVFLQSFAEHLGKPHISARAPGNVVHPVLGNILRFLDQFGALYRAMNDSSRSPETCVYETEVFDEHGACFLTISYSFILDVSTAPEFSFLLNHKNTASRFKFVKCKFGSMGVGSPVRTSKEFSVAQEDLFGTVAEESGMSINDLLAIATPNTKKGKSKKSSYDACRLKFNYAVKSGKIEIHKSFVDGDKTYCILLGQDAWFEASGFPPNKLTPKDMEGLKIIEVKPSELMPGQHVIVIETD